MNAQCPTKVQDKDTQFQLLIGKYLFYWKWFLLSLVVCAGGGYLILRYADKVYLTQAIILLEDEKKPSGDMAGLGELARLARGSSSSAAFVNDQVQIMNSRRIIKKVVEDNRLYIIYKKKGAINEIEIAENESPIKIVLLEPDHRRLDSIKYEFTVVNKGDRLLFSDNLMKDKAILNGTRLNTPVGPILVVRNKSMVFNSAMRIVVVPKQLAVNLVRKQLSITANAKKQSFSIHIAMRCPSSKKGDLVVASLIRQYNKDVTLDKLQSARSTASFINSRLSLVAQDLALADSQVAEFKEAHNLGEIKYQASSFRDESLEYERLFVEKKTQLALAEMLKESMTDVEGGLLPSNIGLNDATIANNVKIYNELVNERDNLMKSSTSNHPHFINLQGKLADLRLMLEVSLKNYLKTLRTEVYTLENQLQNYEAKLSNMPAQERGLNEIIRQQKIVESIYLFLLQKREENEINASAIPSNIKVVDEAYTYPHPVSPKSIYILIGVVVLALLIPTSILYVKFLLDNKVHTKEDLLELLCIPVLAEIPRSRDDLDTVYSRTPLAEALRILRTNMTYMLGPGTSDGKVIYVTSTISGEGKSFMATNLAKIISQTGKRVLLIGADLRSPRLLDYLGLSHLKPKQIGITQYLVNTHITIENILIRKPEPYDFDVITSGYIAPNPSELLMNGKFDLIVEYGKKNYDFVIVDTAPISLVTDTALIAEYADLTLFVVRAEYLIKRMLSYAQEMYSEGRLKNMSIVLNDVDFRKGYGYGYGYAYDYIGEEKKSNMSWIRKVFQKDGRVS